jgi:thiosulfate dehydrogenase (quinone) large subunit
MKTKLPKTTIGLLRLMLGGIMIWAFFDKVFGLGFATAADKSWLAGNSPTAGFLNFASKGPFADFFQSLSGSLMVDILFMAGLLLIGAALILGIGVKIAGWSGALMMILMYLAVLPPQHHPFIDEHLVYALVFIMFTQVPAGEWLGLGDWWKRQDLVKDWPILE